MIFIFNMNLMSKQFFSYFAVLFIVLIFISVGHAAVIDGDRPRSLCQIKGSVLDQNGSAVAGATIDGVANGVVKANTTTDRDGSFSLSLDPGAYILIIRASGFSSLERKVETCQSATDLIELRLEIERTTAVVDVVEDSAYLFGTISSATKTYTALRDIPQSISLTTKQQLVDQNMTSIGDVVRYQPGITAHQGENNRDQVIIRGQSSSADFFVNGVRDDVQYYRDLYNLERVEFLRGPNALVFGRGGGGGVVNRVTKEANFSPSYGFSLQGGSYGNARGTFDFNKPLSRKFAVRANGVAEYSNSFRRDVSLRRFGFSPTLTYAPDEKTNITATFEFFRDRRTADRGITSFRGRPADVPISTFYGNPDDSRVRANANLFSASVDRTFGKLIVRNRTSYGDYDRFYQNYVPGATNLAGTFVTLTAYNNATKRRNLFNQTDLLYNVKTFGLKHTLLGGFELGRQHSNNFRNTGYFNNSSTTLQVPFSDPRTTVPVTFRQNSSSDADNRVHVNLAALYIQDQIEVNRYLQLVAGARFDYFDLDFHNNRTNVDLGRIDRLVSPRFGVVIKPVSEISLYGSYSVSYLPSAGDQFSSLAANTQTLKPEKFTNYEIGIKWDVRPSLSMTSAVYRLDRTNTRANDPNVSGLLVPTGSQRTNGFEFSLTGNLAREWTVTGGYAYQDAYITRTTTAAVAGADVAQVPHHSFSVWNKYQITRKLGAGLGLVQRSDMFAAISNPAAPAVILPGYLRADAAVYYSFNDRWRLQANIENLFDKRYFLNADNNTNISPGSPRAVKLSLNARF
jgi:catecholate siderophore receptor